MSGVVKKVSSSFFGGAEKEAGKQQAAAFAASGAEFGRAGESIRELFEPQVDFGSQALQQQAALSGALGPEAEALAISQFRESPGQAFAEERGQRNLIRNAASIGGIGGGNVRRALVEQGIGFAQQDFGNRFSRLGAITGLGQEGLTQQAQGIRFGASGVAEGIQGAGQARAAGTVGQAAGFRTGIGELTNSSAQAAQAANPAAFAF